MMHPFLIENMEIHGYRVVAVGPDGKERAPQTTNYSYINLENLSVGEWTIKVYGYNQDNLDLCYGETTVKLTAGKNSARVYLDQLVGKGSLTISLKWDAAAYPKAK